ncbi:hypothetical protein MLD38_039563 [Melastoma candidum]|nr:hypothetical protein MLD38_039563 [Melastoma candidum]
MCRGVRIAVAVVAMVVVRRVLWGLASLGVRHVLGVRLMRGDGSEGRGVVEAVARAVGEGLVPRGLGIVGEGRENEGEEAQEQEEVV